MNSVRRAIFMLSVLLLSLTLPNAVAWRADGWLIQEVVGGERLALGDEFGCHGMPGQSVDDDIAVIDECKDYLASQINASRWGEEPLSFGIPMDELDTLTYNTMHNSVSESLVINLKQILMDTCGQSNEMREVWSKMSHQRP